MVRFEIHINKITPLRGSIINYTNSIIIAALRAYIIQPEDKKLVIIMTCNFHNNTIAFRLILQNRKAVK